MRFIKNSFLFFKFISKVKAVDKENGAYHKYAKHIAAHEISKLHKINDGSISRLHLLKVQWYMATNLYLGELIAGLRTRALSLNEKKALVYLGALMAITDLMTDDFRLEAAKISMLLKEGTREPSELAAIEKLFLLYHERLFAVIDQEKAAYIRDFSLRKPHIESQLQLNQEISEAEIHQLTREKGGTAILLTSSLLFNITERNQKAFYQLGAFIQYLNDSQDIFKDAHAGITTFVSFCNNFGEVNARLKQEFDQTTTLLLQTDFPRASLYSLLFYLNALYTGVLYKNKAFARKLSDTIDLGNIRLMDKTTFRIPMFSMKSLVFCLPRMLKYTMPNI